MADVHSAGKRLVDAISLASICSGQSNEHISYYDITYVEKNIDIY